MAGDCCRCDDRGGKHQRLRNVAREVLHKFIAQAHRNTVDGILLAWVSCVRVNRDQRIRVVLKAIEIAVTRALKL